MHILVIIGATLVILIGVRLTLTALQTAVSGRILIRQGFRSHWQPVLNRNKAWKAACRDGLMGVLLIVLGVVLIT